MPTLDEIRTEESIRYRLETTAARSRPYFRLIAAERVLGSLVAPIYSAQRGSHRAMGLDATGELKAFYAASKTLELDEAAIEKEYRVIIAGTRIFWDLHPEYTSPSIRAWIIREDERVNGADHGSA